jgi:hypothetical protein
MRSLRGELAPVPDSTSFGEPTIGHQGPFPKVPPKTSDSPYGVHCGSLCRGDQHHVRACTPYAAIADLRIQYSAFPQIPIFAQPLTFILFEGLELRNHLR